MTHILVVEDEKDMNEGLKDNLEFEGYLVDQAYDGEEGLEKIKNNTYDLIILDVMLPHLSGFEVCKKTRNFGINTPIIMLTAKGEEIDKVLGLEFGADDYVTKPFSLREMLARIKAILRRMSDKSGTESVINIGKLELDFTKYEACIDKKIVPMTHKEFEIIKYLWSKKNKTVSRDELFNQIWGYDEMTTTRTIDNFILKLRQKIETDPAHPKCILTVHGIGYKLITE
ncbi:response regulator transcription factor [Calditrichota bacterium]